MTSSRVRFREIAAVALLIWCCCTSNAGAPTPSLSRSGALPLDIVAVDYDFAGAPTEISGGAVDLTFENRGTVPHEIAFAGIGDASTERFMEWLGGGNGIGQPFPEYLDQVAVPSFVGAKPGETKTATFTLSPGRYAMFCSYTKVAEGDPKAAHYQLGMMREITVVGGDPTPKLAEADGSITAVDYSFDVDIEAGDTTINFVNNGPDQVHLSTVEEYPKGVDAAEAEEAFKTQLEPGPLPTGVPGATGLGYSGIFSEGLSSTFELYRGEFESGRTYLFECFFLDRDGDSPHNSAYGMYTIVTIE